MGCGNLTTECFTKGNESGEKVSGLHQDIIDKTNPSKEFQ